MKCAEVLFLSDTNACRSQMAEGWGRALHQVHWVCSSAGLTSRDLDPLAVLVMKEAGIDISSQQSRSINSFELKHLDLVVSLSDSARSRCESLSMGLKTLHRGFLHPQSLAELPNAPTQIIDCYRVIRDQVRDFLLSLPAESFPINHEA